MKNKMSYICLIFLGCLGLMFQNCSGAKSVSSDQASNGFITYKYFEEGFECTTMMGDTLSTFKDAMLINSLNNEVCELGNGCNDTVLCGFIDINQCVFSYSGNEFTYQGRVYIRAN